MSLRLNNWIALALILLPVCCAGYLYPTLPETVPIHFNMEGKADGWGSRESIFIGPAILGFVSFFVYLLMINIRKIDPKRYEGADDKVYAQYGLFLVACGTIEHIIKINIYIKSVVLVKKIQ